MRRAVAVLTVGLLLGAADKEDDAKSDQTALQGSWKIVALEKDGMREDIESDSQIRITIKGNRIVVNDENELTFTLDPAATPRLIDFTQVKGDPEGRMIEGVYVLEKDTFKVCISQDESRKQRPTQVKTNPGDGTLVLVLHREKE